MSRPGVEWLARPPLLSAAGLGLLALLGLPPLVAHGPVDWVPSPGPGRAWVSKGGVVLLMLLGIAVCSWAARRPARAAANEGPGLAEPWPARVTLLLLLLAGLMTAWHWDRIDREAETAAWQRAIYLDILSRGGDDPNRSVPHVYRPLAYDCTRALERLTGDWAFACLAYRWFFLYWFMWFWYRFSRLFLPPGPALLALLPYLAYYPVSIARYSGQLTDPLSHALFALALIYLVQDRWLALLAALVLGVLAKETAVLLVPAYAACSWRRGAGAWGKTALLGAGCLLAFAATRWPLGWRPGATLNGVNGLLLWDNLGIGPPSAYSWVPLYERYLHPLGFVLPFLPPIVWNWSATDGKLRALFLTLTPLVVACHVALSWSYESRNYVPALPVLSTLAVQALARAGRRRAPLTSAAAGVP
jgi:hypothetical protein